jgi:hypothetical protein
MVSPISPPVQPVTLPAWQLVWRNAICPLVKDRALLALRRALVLDDPGLLQKETVQPPPILSCADWPCEGCCVIGYLGWQGDDLETVGEVEEFFARFCAEIDRAMGEPAACQYFVNWFDSTPRAEMRKELLQEIERELSRRLSSAA